MDTPDTRLTRRQLGRLAGVAGLSALSVPHVGGDSAGAAPVSAASSAAASQLTITSSGAWCWFGDPRAVHYEGQYRRTYIGYITAGGNITVAQYDHDTGRLTKSVLMSNFPVDDHNNPTICIRPRSDGTRLAVFWTGHADGNHPRIYYRSSVAPEDISAWGPVKYMSKNTSGGHGFTYENLVQISDEPYKLWMFWRGGDFKPSFSTTTGGDLWSPVRTLVDTHDTNRPYLKVAGNGKDKIHFAFTEGHPRNVHTSIYYMYYDAADKNLHRVDGSVIGPMIESVHPSEADKVYDARAAGPKAWVHDVAQDALGRPVIVYATFPTDADHRYRYARWTGTQWFDTEIVAAGGTISADPAEPNYSGGITLDQDNPSIVLLSRQEPGGRHEVERWTTLDGGHTWSTEVITRGSTELNVRPFKPRGLTGNGPLSILWMVGEYPSYTRFQTRIVALGP